MYRIRSRFILGGCPTILATARSANHRRAQLDQRLEMRYFRQRAREFAQHHSEITICGGHEAESPGRSTCAPDRLGRCCSIDLRSTEGVSKLRVLESVF